MAMRLSKRIQIERGVTPAIIPSVSVDAATIARQYGPLGHDPGRPVQRVGEFYDIRASQYDEAHPLYHSPAPWFDGLDRPTRQPSVVPPRQEPPEMSANPPGRPVSYRPQQIDIRRIMRAFQKMAEAMDPSTYEAFPYIPMPAVATMEEGVVLNPAMEAMITQIAGDESACYQDVPPGAQAVHEGTQGIEDAVMTGVGEITAMPMADDGLAALAEQQQEQASQSLEAIVQDQMSMVGPAGPEGPDVMLQQQMTDMMLLGMGFGPGM